MPMELSDHHPSAAAPRSEGNFAWTFTSSDAPELAEPLLQCAAAAAFPHEAARVGADLARGGRVGQSSGAGGYRGTRPDSGPSGTVEVARLYAGDLDVGHPFVRPLNGAFRSLAPMTILWGTRDLLYPDSVDLAERARTAGVPVELRLLRDQPHNYALMPTSEGRAARATILRAMASGMA